MTDPLPVVFFDDNRGQLAPLRDLRSISEVRTGGLTTRERICGAHTLRTAALFVPAELRALAEASVGSDHLTINRLPDTIGGDDAVLIINGRCPLPPRELATLAINEALTDPDSGDLIAARLTKADADRRLGEMADHGQPETSGLATRHPAHPCLLFTRPWHVRTTRDACIALDLELLGRELQEIRPDNCTVIGDCPILAAPDTTIFPGSIFDTTHGPIAIRGGATVRPGSTIIGPAIIGKHATVIDRALIKGGTAVGPVCKVAGEISGTIFQGYSNKGHDGYLGDSWVGEWVNLGAGTTNSNLLNTYSEVTAVAEPHAHREKTGETFFGCVLGDHVKAAICTRIMTGSIVHTGAMWAATAPIAGCIDRFAWSTDKGVRHYRVDRFLDVMHASMARRSIKPSPALNERIKALAAAAE